MRYQQANKESTSNFVWILWSFSLLISPIYVTFLPFILVLGHASKYFTKTSMMNGELEKDYESCLLDFILRCCMRLCPPYQYVR